MSINLIERPYKFNFSENEIRYGFYISNPTAAGCRVEIELYVHAINTSGSGTKVAEIPLVPDSDGKCFAYLDDFLKSFVEAELPEPLLQVTPAQASTKYFYIRYRQVTDAGATSWNTEIADKRIVIMGGVEKEKASRNNFFENYKVPNKTFMTWWPSHRFVHIDQAVFLSYLHTGDMSDDLRFVADVIYIDGTTRTVTINLPPLTSTILYHIAANVKALGLDTVYTGSRIYYYEVKVINQADEVLANTFRFYIEYRKFYSVWDLAYQNSLSGIDTIRVIGDHKWIIDRITGEVEMVQPRNAWQSRTVSGQFRHSMLNSKRTYQGDVGFVNRPAEQEVLAETLLATKMAMMEDNRWIPIRINNKGAEGLSNDKKWSWPLEWEIAMQNRVFTPRSVNLGMGTDTESYSSSGATCDGPTGLVVYASLTNVGAGMKQWVMYWDLQTCPGWQFEYRKVGAGSWTQTYRPYPYRFAVIEIPEDGSMYEWRVRTDCGTGDYSGYVNGTQFTS